MAFQTNDQGQQLNPLTGKPLYTPPKSTLGPTTQTPGITASVTNPTAQTPGVPQNYNQPQPTGASYLADPTAWIRENYGAQYLNADGTMNRGVKTVRTGANGISMTSYRKTPETHPWEFMGNQQADVNGQIYGEGPGVNTGTGYEGGRQASAAERQASYDSNNYYRNGNQGLDPGLMSGMTRNVIGRGRVINGAFEPYSNQYGSYTPQHAIVDEQRKLAGLDPWVEKSSSFQGVNQFGNPVNWQNSDAASGWADGGIRTLSQAGLHQNTPNTYSGPTPAGRIDPNWMDNLPGGNPNNPGNGNPGGNSGGGNPGNGNPGSGNPGGNPGSGNPGNGNPGSGNPGSGGQGTNNQQLDQYREDAENYGNDQDPITTDIITRDVGDKELSSYWLNELLDKGGPWAERAMQQGRDQAGARGLMNSSIAAGNAYGALVDRAQPFALDNAATYGRAASENMTAQNQGRLQDSGAQQQMRSQKNSQMRDFLLGSATDLNRADINIESREDDQDFRAGEAEMDRNWRTGERLGDQGFRTGERLGDQGWRTGERIGDQGFRTGERKDAQQYNSSEREAIEAFNRGERLDNQNWTNDQRAAAESFQWQRDQLGAQMELAGINQRDRDVWIQAWTNFQIGKANSVGAAGAAIYSQMNLTPAQQNFAVQNMMTFYNSVFPGSLPFDMPGTPSPGGVGAPYNPYAPPAAQGGVPPFNPKIGMM